MPRDRHTQVQSGCFSKASRATGAKPSSTAVTRTRAARPPAACRPGARLPNCRYPAPHRRSSAATRRASSRSGVTRAAVRPSSFSVSRSARATDQRLLWGLAQSARVTCSSDDAGGQRPRLGGLRRPHQFGDQQMPRRAAAAGPVGDIGALAIQSRQAARAGRIADAIGSSSFQLSLSISRSRPGNTTAPCGSRAMAASRSRVAGCEPVEPAAITGVAGGTFTPARPPGRGSPGCAVRCASIWPRSASTFGQASPTMARNLSVRCQWLAKLPSTRPFELAERHALDGKLVEQPPELARELQRLRRRLGDGMALGRW